MKGYTCMAIDDEYPATQIIQAYVDKTPQLNLICTFTSAPKALQFLSTNPVDILFLDIQMPDINGLEFSQNLIFKPKIIFTTAYDQYALEGFNVDAVDYLLKPFSLSRFSKAVSKAVHLIDLESISKTNPLETEDYIVIKSDYKLHKIDYHDIDYIEGLKAYVSFFVNGKRYITLESLKNLEQKLPNHRFLRVHKSFIVPLEKIKALNGNLLELATKQIPIGKSYKEKVLNRVFKSD